MVVVFKTQENKGIFTSFFIFNRVTDDITKHGTEPVFIRIDFVGILAETKTLTGGKRSPSNISFTILYSNFFLNFGKYSWNR
jgi:hypothetical protein